MTDAHPVSTPTDSNVHLQNTVKDDDSSVPDFSYQGAVDNLLYLACTTRPDIAHAVNIVSQYSSNPRGIHVTSLKCIFKYLCGTCDFSLYYSGLSVPNILTAYSNADYAGNLDDRKSQTGCCLMLNNGPTTWFSRKQQCVAMSTAESEYIATTVIGRKAQWTRHRLINLGYN